MFIGHYALALGAKKIAPKASLGVLIGAAALLDLIWPVLILIGVETVSIVPGATAFTPLEFTHYPWSHSLLMSLVWAGLAGGAYWYWKRDNDTAMVIGALVLSHWFLDAAVHKPDLPVSPFSDSRVGLGIWDSVGGTLMVELFLLAAGWWLYRKATKSRDKIGTFGLIGLIAAMLILYAAAAFGPPPPSVNVIAYADFGQVLIILLAWWVDKHRSVRPAAAKNAAN